MTEVGTLLSIVIGMIGLLNLFNTIMMSITARRHELSLLECVGMTKRQIYRMLSIEGFLYGFGTFIISLTVTCVLSITVLRGIIEQIWFMSFKFDIMPALIAFPIMIILAAAASVLIGYFTLKQPLSLRVRPQE